MLVIEKSIYKVNIFLYKVLFLSSSIGILFILLGIVFFINFSKSSKRKIFKREKNLKETKISMNSILKYIDTGIIITNKKGKIKCINYYAKSLLIQNEKKQKNLII